MMVEGLLHATVKNVAKALLTNINLYFPIANRSYLKKAPIADGTPKPGIRDDKLDNIYLRFRIKELKHGEDLPLLANFSLETKEIDMEDYLYESMKRAKSKRVRLVYPEGLRRIRKIAERLERKSKLLIDFEEELIGFVERNFQVLNEVPDSGLEKLLKDNIGDASSVVDFAIAVHKNVNIDSRKVFGVLVNHKEDATEKHYWFEIRIRNKWIPIDLIRKAIGKLGDNYVAVRIINQYRAQSEVEARYNINKRYIRNPLLVKFERVYRGTH